MNHLVLNSDGTVTDTKNGLIWSQKTLAKDVSFDRAVKAVEALGEGWRLPTIDELLTLVDRSRHSPAIDIEAFPDTENDWYWTATPTAWNTSAFWLVDFDYGHVGLSHRSNDACGRAVRSVPAGQ